VAAARFGASARPAEIHQPGFLGVEPEPVLLESLREHGQHPPRVVLPLEGQHRVVGVAHHEGTPPQARHDVAVKPDVEHLVQVDVREQGADHPTLGSPLLRVPHHTFFHHSGVQPLPEGATHHPVPYPLVEKAP